MKVLGPHQPRPVDPVRSSTIRRTATPTSARRDGDSVTISGEARTLFDARGPEQPDAAKVAALRDRIRSGTFRVDADRIADAMITEETA